MATTRNIVILGASYAGLGAAHYIARHILPSLPKDDTTKYHLIVVDPSSKWYPRHMAPRAVASEKLMPDEVMFQDTVAALEQYGEAVTFLQGSAISWDQESRVVTVRKVDTSEETVPYFALVVATGSKSASPLFSLQGTPHTDVQHALRETRQQLAAAKRIVIAGGGPTGVETAGEIGEALNGAPGWFSSTVAEPKAHITLVTSSDQLLPSLKGGVGKQAEAYLKRVGVDVMYGTKIASAHASEDGRTSVELDNGETLSADVYIPAMGLTPMSGFVPETLRDAKGYVRTNEKTLRVDEAGARVYAIGDVGSYSENSIVEIYDSIPVLGTNMKRDLLAAHSDVDAKAAGPDRVFKLGMVNTQLVPVGRSRGVGNLLGWTVPSFLVWLIKGRDYMAWSAKDTLTGKKWAKESAWKAPKAEV